MTRDTLLAERVTVAGSFWARFRGLMLRSSLAAGEGLFLGDNSIHMFFMRFAIDAVFVGPPDAAAGGQRAVVAVRPDLPTWRGLVLPVRGAVGVIELEAGAAARAGVVAGDQLAIEAVEAGGGYRAPRQ